MGVMTRRSFTGNAVVACVLARTQAMASAAAPGLSSGAVRAILTDRIRDLTLGQGGIGIVAGLTDAKGQNIVVAGQNDRSDPRLLDGNSVFEIGSVGKVFTALLLSDMVLRGEILLEAPVAHYLPTNTHLPERNGRAITIVDLATHMSGLPFMPDPPKVQGGNAPAYTETDIYRFLTAYKLTRNPGSDWDYSNLGYWLLGEALATRGGMSFVTLLHERVLRPLNMTDSGFELTPRMKANLAIGHDASLQRAQSMSTVPIYNLMPATGVGFYSTANDLLTFLSAAMGQRSSPLSSAFKLEIDTKKLIPHSTNVQALGWTLVMPGTEQLVFRDGGTLGFASCVAWRPHLSAGIVVLANCVGDVGDIAQHILAPEIPLKKPVVNLHREITLDRRVLSRYSGHYLAAGEGVFTIAFEGDHLTFESPPEWGLPKLRIRAETDKKFFASELPLRVEFQGEADRPADSITVFPPRGQKGIVAKRPKTTSR